MQKLFLFLAALALVGSACSADVASEVASISDSAESAEPAQVPQDAADATEAEPTAAAVAAEPETSASQDEQQAVADETAATDQADAPNTFNVGGSDSWCDIFRSLEAEEDNDDRLFSGDPQQVEAYYRDQTELMLAVQRVAPPEVASDFALVVEQNVYLMDAFEAAGWDVARVDPGVFDFEASGYEQALVNMETYNYEACGIPLE